MQAKLVGAMVELLQKYESLLGGVVVVRAVRDALVSEGVRLYSTGHLRAGRSLCGRWARARQ